MTRRSRQVYMRFVCICVYGCMYKLYCSECRRLITDAISFPLFGNIPRAPKSCQSRAPRPTLDMIDGHRKQELQDAPRRSTTAPRHNKNFAVHADDSRSGKLLMVRCTTYANILKALQYTWTVHTLVKYLLRYVQ